MILMSNPALCKFILPKVKGREVLDVGAGSGLYGFLLKFAPERTEDCIPKSVDAIDFDPETVAHLNSMNSYRKVYEANSDTLPFADNSYDTVICLENIEHLYAEEVYKAIKELYRVSKDVIIISTPPPRLIVMIEDVAKQLEELKNSKRFVSYKKYRQMICFLHKCCFAPCVFIAAGFRGYVDDNDKNKMKLCEGETNVYIGYKKDLKIENLQYCYAINDPLVLEVPNKDYNLELQTAMAATLNMGRHFGMLDLIMRY